MRSPLFILLATFILTLLIAQEFSPARRSSSRDDQPLEQFAFLLQQYPDLGAALAAADRGEPAPLLAWLNGAPPLARQALASVLIQAAYAVAGLAPDDLSSKSDQAIHRWRRRFAAFTNIPTGNPELDASLDNLIAYIAVAGTDAPAASELAQAQALLPRIEKTLALNPNHEVYDTVGCIYFVAGDYARARTAFGEAVRLAEKQVGPNTHGKQVAATLPLYRARLDAAINADRRTVEQRADAATRPRLPLADSTLQAH